ncbi:BTB/POZ domain-containing protein 19 isoform X2 [Dermochelys coriacea]|uniref:BTB/POZ domain-containing protein 19 isoform X2 n=1 Tax=Dermochelys coriacea TaxID=27794 RepID=UPI0018E73546|nr:BTB/POZ domain-containing protein 19 isoform X2 [Dermochelys coriacea]
MSSVACSRGLLPWPACLPGSGLLPPVPAGSRQALGEIAARRPGGAAELGRLSLPHAQPCSLPPASVASPGHGLRRLGRPGGGRGCLRHSHQEPRQQPAVQALEVLTSAVEYGLDDLRKLCVEFLVGALSVELVCEALQAAVTYGQMDLQEHCLVFVEDHTREVVQTRSFHELSGAALVVVLHSDRLAIDEPDLIRAVREWAHVSSAVLERPVAEVAAGPVRELRLPLLSPRELAALESHNQRDPLIPVECIAEAWKCHVLRKGRGAPSRLCQCRRGTQPREHHSYLQ